MDDLIKQTQDNWVSPRVIEVKWTDELLSLACLCLCIKWVNDLFVKKRLTGQRPYCRKGQEWIFSFKDQLNACYSNIYGHNLVTVI